MAKDFEVKISIGFNRDMTTDDVEQYFDQLIGEWSDKVESWGTEAKIENE